MNSNLKIALAVVVGAAFGAAAVQGLHAQAKPKAYIVSESQVLDAAAAAAYSPVIQAAQKAAGGRSFPDDWQDCCNRGVGSPACGYQRVGQPGAGAGMVQLGS
jgi:hypothetical protein